MDSKAGRLASYKAEVKDFHPVLKSIFRKAKPITHVEYTHGVHEKGADFVLTVHNEALDSSDYIGVIVKVGPLGKSDVRALEEQIKDCKLERYTLGGKRKIKLDGVWIITNGTISTNAQETIENAFQSQKIEFLDCDRLIGFIDKWFPSFWSEIPVQASSYFDRIRLQIDDDEKRVCLIPTAAEIYIEQSVYHEDSNVGEKNWKRAKSKRIDLIQDIAGCNTLLIEGEAGSGKSKLLRHTAKRFCSEEVYNRYKLVPILTTLKELLEVYSGNLSKLVESKMGVDFPLLKNEASIPAIFLDSLDEVCKGEDELTSKLIELNSLHSEEFQFKLIVATRPYNYGKASKGQIDGIRRLSLAPLSTAQVFSFLTDLCKKVALNSRLREDIKDSPLFRDLPRSPIAAILLADIINQKVEELPSTLPELYSKYFELMLGRWEIDKGLRSQMEYEALDAILMNIAEHFMNNEITCMSLDEVKEQFFEEYLKHRNFGIKANDLFEVTSSRCGIIAINKEKGLFSFRHRTFAEFLFARKGAKQPNREPLQNNIFTLYWNNTAYFYMGLLKDCPEVIEQVLALTPETELSKWVRMDSIGNFLLAAYSTPYEVITKAVKTIALELGEFCYNVIEQKQESILQQFPKMFVIWIAQYTFAQRYGYKFLHDALANTIMEIAADQNRGEAEAYSLFILSQALDRAGGDEMFIHLMQAFDTLPLPIQIAIQAASEKEDRSRKSALLKKQNAHLRKSIKRSQGIHSFYKECFNKPIKTIKKES